MNGEAMLTLALVALLTLSTVGLLAVRASLRADIRTLIVKVSGLEQENKRLDRELAEFVRQAYELASRVEEHHMSWHPPEPKPPARKAAAKKAPAKKAAPKKAVPAKKATRQRSVS